MPFSPPQSVASSSGPSSPLTVKKLVIDGRSKGEGALFRMYLKLSVCVDNIQPGALLPLFPELNSRILSSQVHPLDGRFSPYHFSPDDHPLIQKAANALQLPSTSPVTYANLFSVNDPDTSRRHRGIDRARYSAQVLISAYTVTLALPKEFPPVRETSMRDSEGEEISSRQAQHSQSARKQPSIFKRNYLNYVVAVELSIPFLTTPPRGPFLISIPVPRCLDNQLRMRIAIPLDSAARITRNGGDSTSSGDDMAGWDFLTDPPVTRRLDRTGVRNGDEDHPSDQNSITPGVEVIQGAFQSTDYLHVRWAPPLPRRSRPENGMWRANMQSSTAMMKCQILARTESALRLGISYEATCSELWHPGVATIVGLDVVLDAKRRSISWPEEDHLKGWSITAKGEALVGIHKDISQAVSRHSSLESTFSSTFLPTLNNDSMFVPPRGSASLLHAPLPSNNPPDYSFENNSPNGMPRENIVLHPPGTPSKGVLQTSRDSPPNIPTTLRINMLKLLQSPKNEVTFTIRGVIILKLDPNVPEDSIPLPKFNVLGIHAQEVKTWVSMHIPSTKDFYLDEEHPSEHSRRRLMVGEEVRCEEETLLIVSQSRSSTPNSHSRRLSPNFVSNNESSSPSRKVSRISRVSRNSPLATRIHAPTIQPNGQATSLATAASPSSLKTSVLAHVIVSITPLNNSLIGDRYPHRVRVTLPVYSLGSDTIQFSLATMKAPDSKPISPKVDLLYGMYSGRQIPAEIYKVADNNVELTASNMITTNRSGSQVFGEMQYSISLDTGGVESDLGPLDCVYLVDFPQTEEPGKRRTSMDKSALDALLPCFHIPVLMYEVLIESAADSYNLESTTLNQQSFTKFSQYHVPAGFYPTLRISLLPRPSRKTGYFKVLHYILVYTVLISSIFQLLGFRRDLLEMRSSVGAVLYGLMNDDGPRSFIVGNHHSWNEHRMGQGDPSRDWRHLETPMVIVSTVTTTLTVTQTSATSTPSTEGGIEDNLVRTIHLSDAPRVQYPQPTPFRENIKKEMKALIQLRAPSFSSYTLPFAEERKTAVRTLMKFVYFLRKVWNFPMDPD